MVYAIMLDYAPHCEYAEQARSGLSLALQLFELGSRHGSGRAKRALVGSSIYMVITSMTCCHRRYSQ
jgi:hypothetical protein